MSKPRPHFAHLDGLRAIAALWVVLGHALIQSYPMIYGQYVSGSLAVAFGWLNYAHFAVSIFIVLSGFSLMLPIVTGSRDFSSARFFRNRARRILPPFYIALVFSFLMDRTIISQRTGTLWDICLPATWQAMVSNLFLMQEVFCNYRINCVFWSIAVEAKIYCLFPLLLLGWKKIGPTTTSAIAVFSGYVCGFLFLHTSLECATVYYVALFACGMLAAEIAVRPLQQQSRQIMLGIALIAAVSVLTVCLLLNVQSATANFIYLDGLVGIATAAFLIYLHTPNRLRNTMGWKPLAFIGTFSYSLYLIHLPLLQLTWVLIVAPLHATRVQAFLIMLCAVPAIVWMAYLFSEFFERPFMSSTQARAVNILAQK